MIRREKTTTESVYSSVRLPMRSSLGTTVAIHEMYPLVLRFKGGGGSSGAGGGPG